MIEYILYSQHIGVKINIFLEYYLYHYPPIFIRLVQTIANLFKNHSHSFIITKANDFRKLPSHETQKFQRLCRFRSFDSVFVSCLQITVVIVSKFLKSLLTIPGTTSDWQLVNSVRDFFLFPLHSLLVFVLNGYLYND